MIKKFLMCATLFIVVAVIVIDSYAYIKTDSKKVVENSKQNLQNFLIVRSPAHCNDFNAIIHFGTEGKVLTGEKILRIAFCIRDSKYLTDFQKINAIRELVHQQIIILGEHNLLDTNQLLFQKHYVNYPERIFDVMNRMHKGVWCGGAGSILAYLYHKLGYKSWIYGYGQEDGLTHVVTLVLVKGRLYLEDAYFNLAYMDSHHKPLSFFQLLYHLKKGIKPVIAEGKHLCVRLGVVSSRFYPRCHFASVGGISYRRYSYYNFIKIWSKMRSLRIKRTVNLLKERGYPVDYEYLLLVPDWLTNAQTNAYFSYKDAKKSPLLTKIVSVVLGGRKHEKIL